MSSYASNFLIALSFNETSFEGFTVDFLQLLEAMIKFSGYFYLRKEG